jgi:hypothetical protein
MAEGAEALTTEEVAGLLGACRSSTFVSVRDRILRPAKIAGWRFLSGAYLDCVWPHRAEGLAQVVAA